MKAARWRKGFPSVKRATRKAVRLMRGRREDGLTKLEAAFGITRAPQLLLFSVGRADFDPNERARRRARGKRQRAARRAGR